jgi:transcriptional regulator
MYTPSSFQEKRPEKLYEFIRSYSFGTLFSGVEGSLQASHLPFLFDEKAGSQGILTGHMAKANPHWQSLSGREVLVVFQGPHVYISPTWYEEIETVPTWNYVAVHVYGQYASVMDESKLMQILEKTVGVYEAPMPRPWDMKGLPETYLRKMINGIVGFEIVVNRIEGKWKLSQNHPEGRRQKVVRALEKQGKPNASEMAKLMASQDPF